MNDTFMKEKPVGPLLASMALPMVFSMLVNSLYNIVDSFFVAQISEQAMTALSLVYRSEHDQRRCHRLRDRNQRQSFLSPWRRGQKWQTPPQPTDFSVCDPWNPDDCDQHRCYARIPSDVYPG